MTLQRRDISQIAIADLPKDIVRAQVGALCWRVEKGKAEVLLITSRDTGRWVIPKGWPMKGKTGAQAACQEAWEEAGATGKISGNCIGLYAYNKVLGPGSDVPCIVSVYPMKIQNLAKDFPEAKERKRRWFGPKKAASRVDELELRDILRSFDPKSL